MNGYTMSKSKLLLQFIIPMLLCGALVSCEKNYILEQNQPLKDCSWNYKDTQTFTAEIKDTIINYDIYIHMRHGFNFEWRNVWVKIETTFPDGREFEKRVNLVLGEADGRWLGNCLGDNCDIRIPIQQSAFFPYLGKYTFKITQDMRTNPLGAVKSVGMEIQQSKK